MRHRILTMMISSVLFGAGCQGTGQVVNIDLQTLPAHTKATTAVQDDSLLIAVETFTDARPDHTHIGKRTHLWGGVTYFDAWDGQIGEGIANLAYEYLKQRRWNAIRLNQASSSSPQAPDVTLTGNVLHFEALAKSGFGFTKIDVALKIGFEARNATDGSTVRMVLGSNGTDTVVFFSPEDIQTLTNEVAKDLFDQLFRDLVVKDRALRLRSVPAL